MRRALMRSVRRPWLLPILFLSCLRCGADAPTSPDRHGIPQVTIVCVAGSLQTTICRAPVSCSLYPCAEVTPTDVTDVAVWSVDNTAVARVVAPGVVESVGVGHTVL